MKTLIAALILCPLAFSQPVVNPYPPATHLVPGSTASGGGSGVSYCAPASASTTAYTCTPSTALTSYTAGTVLAFIPDVTGAGGATTVNVSGLGAKSIKQANGSSNPTSQGLPSGVMQYLTYDGTNFRSSLGVGQAQCTITAATSVTCTHNLGLAALDGPLYMSAYKSTGAIVGGTTATPLQITDVVQVDANSATFTFNTAWTGTFWVSNGLTGPAGATGATGPQGIPGVSPTANQNIRNPSVTFLNGGSALSGSTNSCKAYDYGGTISKVTLIGDQTGSATVDVRTIAYASYTGPASTSSIAAAAIPALSSATKYQDSTLTGWTTTLAAGSVICFYLSSPSTVTSVVLTLDVVAN